MKISISCKAPDAAAVTESGQQALPLPQLHPSPTHLTGNYSFKNEKSKRTQARKVGNCSEVFILMTIKKGFFSPPWLAVEKTRY